MEKRTTPWTASSTIRRTSGNLSVRIRAASSRSSTARTAKPSTLTSAKSNGSPTWRRTCPASASSFWRTLRPVYRPPGVDRPSNIPPHTFYQSINQSIFIAIININVNISTQLYLFLILISGLLLISWLNVHHWWIFVCRMYWLMILFRLLLLRAGVFFASSFFLKLRRRYARVPCWMCFTWFFLYTVPKRPCLFLLPRWRVVHLAPPHSHLLRLPLLNQLWILLKNTNKKKPTKTTKKTTKK